MKMKFFDLHCDTIAKIVDEKANFGEKNHLHVHLKGLEFSKTAAQVFACFVPGYHKTPDQVFDKCNRYISEIKSLADEYPEQLILADTADQLEQVIEQDNKTAVIVSIEGAAPLKGDPDLLEHFFNRGVRLLTIAWDDNEFCGTVFGNNGGLTLKGKELIENCRHLGVGVDLSHASDQAFWDVASYMDGPFAASHSNARAICPNDRNLSDAMIKTIADRGGIIGLTYGSGFVSTQYYEKEKVNRIKILTGLRDGNISIGDAHKISHKALAHLKRARLDDLVRHTVHILDKGGEDCLGLGSDFDGVDSLVESVNGVSDMPLIFESLQKERIPSRILEKIACHNALAFFKRVL